MKRLENISPFIVMDILKEAKGYKDTIHMEIGEPDLLPPEKVIKAYEKAIFDNKFYYTEALGLKSLREEISKYYKHKYKVDIPIERIAVTPGTSGAFLVAMSMLLDAGDRYAISDPSYPCYKNFGYFLNADPRFIPVKKDTNFEITTDQLVKYNDIKALILSSPANPFGKLYNEDNFKSLINYCDSKGIYFISDEIYHGLSYERDERSALCYSDEAIVISSFSKSFCMPGFRIGWMILPQKLVRTAEIIIQNIFIAANTPSQYAAVSAFDYNYLKIVKDTFRKRRDFLYKELSNLFDITAKPDSAFYIWADMSRYMNDSFRFCDKLLKEEHLAVTPGIDFGNIETEKFIRFSYTKDISELKLGVIRLKRFLERL